MSEENEFSEIKVRISKEEHANLWKVKIFARVTIEKFVQKALKNELRRMNL